MSTTSIYRIIFHIRNREYGKSFFLYSVVVFFHYLISPNTFRMMISMNTGMTICVRILS